VTGTARGLRAADCAAAMIGVSVDLGGLHMASDKDFNRKSFTTGHTGFSIPFTSWPDRVDVPRNAARPLRYLDRFVTDTQGEVFYATELLARIEGLERGPAGNTSLAAAVAIAAEYDEEEIIVVSETEYTGAGKSPVAQLMFAEEMGVEVRNGLPTENRPGAVIAIPTDLAQLQVVDVDLDRLRSAYVRRAVNVDQSIGTADTAFLREDTNASSALMRELVAGHE
jgi:hypothetical protein